MASQVAGYPLSNSTPLTLSVAEATARAEQSSAFLNELLYMAEPQQLKSNEIAKDTYGECIQLRDYISEKLWSVSEDESVNALQKSLDTLGRVCAQYELVNTTNYSNKKREEEDWEFVEVDVAQAVPSC
ncbi:hypothetical protein BCR43DRAFT_493667 [Syncephalastrum racemosum]|uniref:Uncharacterized protein n=1 Tax=Syncephalastrum racemosum TaxID=13706 RepID=A0A1X2HAX7_SYNRA|nr:hypothetical protein BCR43DRAFT_493667 [Syncephalastrum racemosum]